MSLSTQNSNEIRELIKYLKDIEWMLNSFPLFNAKDLTWKDDQKVLKDYREILYKKLMILVKKEVK
ncbi:MAG: hypothetical protein LBR43_01880 [Spiroplasmataceae bacterium]|jgi:hypothetical protein|nr:hypothetical protein [Spiroplasmataceae bacterium]